MAFWLGEAYSKMGKFDEAIAIWKDLIGKQPHQCQFHDTLA
jgi:TolA-binding protein